jgi:hypothetical protein
MPIFPLPKVLNHPLVSCKVEERIVEVAGEQAPVGFDEAVPSPNRVTGEGAASVVHQGTCEAYA